MVLVVLFLGAISFDLWAASPPARYAAADQAAQAGANALDETLYRSSGQRKLDPASERTRERQPREPGSRRHHNDRGRGHARPDRRRAHGNRRRGLAANLWGRRPPRRPRPLRRTASRGQPMKRTPPSSSRSSFSLLAAAVVTWERHDERVDQTGRHRHHNRSAVDVGTDHYRAGDTHSRPRQPLPLMRRRHLRRRFPPTRPTGRPSSRRWDSVAKTSMRHPMSAGFARCVPRNPPCAEQLDVQLADLANKGWHVVDADPYTVVSASSRTSTATASTLHWSSRSFVEVQRPANGARSSTRRVPWSRGIDPETDEGINTENRTTLGRSGPPEDPWRIISQERIREVPG